MFYLAHVYPCKMRSERHNRGNRRRTRRPLWMRRLRTPPDSLDSSPIRDTAVSKRFRPLKCCVLVFLNRKMLMPFPYPHKLLCCHRSSSSSGKLSRRPDNQFDSILSYSSMDSGIEFCYVGLSVQGDPEGLGLGYVDLVYGSSLGCRAATIATYCPRRMTEHLKS